VYAVNGTSKPYWDHALGRMEGDRHAWKRRFHEHVAALGRSLRDRGFDLLLIGDWNVSQTKTDTTPRLRTEEPHATSRAHFASTLVEGLELVDVFRQLHPDMRAYTWFHRRSRPGRLDAARVDFALLSRSRMPDVVEATIDEQYANRFGSDHAPIHLKLSRDRREF
jgi:exodeoxyribonuclease-3